MSTLGIIGLVLLFAGVGSIRHYFTLRAIKKTWKEPTPTFWLWVGIVLIVISLPFGALEFIVGLYP